MKSGQGTAPGAKPSIWVRKTLSLLLAVCMAASLCPAAALAAPGAADRAATSDDAQIAIDAWVPTDDAQGGAVDEDDTTSAETTVEVSTYSSFRAVDCKGPQGTITSAEATYPNTDSGRLWAKFEGGRPYPTGAQLGDQSVSGSHYVMELTWTKNGHASSAYSLKKLLPASSSIYEAEISLNDIFGKDDLAAQKCQGKYVFKMVLEGEGAQRSTAAVFAEFTINDSKFTKDRIDNTAAPEQPQAVVWGSFNDAAVLNVADITTGEGSAAATLGMLQDAANSGVADGENGNSIVEAWQIDVVNGTLLPDAVPFDRATDVQIELSDGTRDALVDADEFSIVSVVGGQTHVVTFKKDAGQTEQPFTYTSTTTGADGAPLVATLTLPEGGKATLSFQTEGLGGSLGAFGVALPVPASETYTVEASAANGTISPAGTTTRPTSTAMVFTLSPLGGYVLEGAKVLLNGSAAPYSAYSLVGNTLTLNPRAKGSTTQLRVEFPPYTQGSQPDAMDMQVNSKLVDGSTAGGSVRATFQKVGEDGIANEVTEPTAATANPLFQRVQAGTSVRLTFDPPAGYVVRGVRMGATQTAVNNASLMTVSGNAFTVSAMGENTQLVEVVYEQGVQPPTADVTYQVKAWAGEGGTVAGSGEAGVPRGGYFASTVQATGDYVIDTVKLYNGVLAGMPDASVECATDLTAVAQGKKTYKVQISAVLADMTVVATFKQGPATVNVAQPAGGRVWLASAGQDSQPPYQVDRNTQAQFAFSVQDGYTFDGLWIDGQKFSLTDPSLNVQWTGAGRGTFTVQVTSGSITLTPVFVPDTIPAPEDFAFATVASDGNGAVSPEGGVSFARDGSLTLNFGTVEGKEAWRASKLTVAAGDRHHSIDLKQESGEWASYTFTPSAAPWVQQLGAVADVDMYLVTVEFKDMTNGGEQPNPKPLPQLVDIAIATTAGGTVSPTGTLDGDRHVYQATPGVQQSFALIPDVGYHVDKVWLNVGDGGQMVDVTGASVGGKPYVSGSTLAFTPNEGAIYALLVEFKADAPSEQLRWNVITSATGGSVTPTGTTQTQDGQTAIFSFLPDTGKKLTGVKVRTSTAGSSASDFAAATERDYTGQVVDNTLKLTINAHTQVVATFGPLGSGDPQPEPKKTLTLRTAVAGGVGGTVSPAADNPQTLPVDGQLTISFKQASGYTLQKVDVACDSPALAFSPKVTDMHEDSGTYSYVFGLPSNVQADSFAGKTVTVTATFTKEAVSHTVTVKTEGPAGVAASAGPLDESGYGYVSPGYASGGTVEVGAGASQMFYFVERPGYVVDSVYVGSQRVAGSVQSYLLAGVVADTTLTVKYVASSNSGGTDEDTMHTVSASVADGSTGSISPAEARVADGGSVVLTMLPADGYKLGTLVVTPAGGSATTVYDAADQGTFGNLDGNTYTLGPVTKGYQVRATFTKAGTTPGGDDDKRPTVPEQTLRHITVKAQGPGAVSPAGDANGVVTVPQGGQQTFSFLPNEEADAGMVNVLEKVVIERGGITYEVSQPGGYYTLSNVIADQALTAYFKTVQKGGPDDNKPTYDRHTVTVAAGEGGRIEPADESGKAGTTVVNAGASLTVRLVPDAGYHASYVAVKAVSGDGSVQYVPASQLKDSCYTLANIRGDYEVRAVFAADGSGSVEEGFTAYTIEVDGSKALASLTGVVQVKQGDDRTLVLTPTYGNTVTRVSVLAADGRELWQQTYSGTAASAAIEVPLIYRAGVASAVVRATYGTSQTAGSDDAVYTVTTRVAADDQGNKLGTITPGGSQQFKAGSNITFTLVPFAGCTVDTVTANGNPVAVAPTSDGYYQFTATDLSGALTVVAKFRKIADGEDVPAPGKTAQVTFNVQGAGSVQPSSPARVKPGDDLTITLVPKAGATLGTLVVGGRNVTADVEKLKNGSYQYTIKGVTADMQVDATFVNADGSVDDVTNDLNIDVQVKVEVAGNVYGGAVDPSQPFTVKPGASQLFLIKPADGFYVADVEIRWADGRSEHPQVRDWRPDYSNGTMGSAMAQAQSASDQTAQVSSIGRTSGAVQKPYSYVQVDNIRSNFTMYVTLDDCLKDPANADQNRYLYTDAANGLVTTDPSVNGNGTVTPGDNTDVVGPGGDKTLIITPGVKDDGTLEDLKSITIHGVTIDLTGDDVRDASGKQVPELVVQKVKNYKVDGKPVLRPGEDFKWVPEPAPGHYELTLKAEQDENGKWTIDQPKVDFTGAGPAYTNRIVLRSVEIDANGNRVPVDAGVLTVRATRLDDNKTVENGTLDLAYGGAVRVEAELHSADYQLVSIGPDEGGNVSTAPREEGRAAEPAAQSGTGNTFYAYGPGAIVAAVQKKSATENPAGNVFYVTATAGTGGSISAAKESYQVGEEARFTLTPANNYQVASITVNGTKMDYADRSYTVPRELCVKDARITVHAEFKALVPAAGDPQTSADKRALRTLQSLASTGDAGAPLMTGLLAIACGAMGIAVLVWSRSRRRLEPVGEHAEDSEE